MNKQLQSAKAYLSTDAAKEIIIGVTVVAGILAVVATIALIVQHNSTKIVFQPSVACDLFSRDEAKGLLGEQVLHNDPTNPVLTGHVATTKCSYTDMNSDKDKMLVAAVAVRSGIDEQGVKQNKSEFVASKAGKNVEEISDVGDSAYFNHERGQLNVLKGHDWIIMSFGAGSSPAANTVDGSRELAQAVLLTDKLPTF